MEKEKCRCGAVVLAAGSGKRMHSDIKKQFLLIQDKPVIYYSLQAFQQSFIDEIVLVVSEEDRDYCKKNIVDQYGFSKVKYIEAGGKERYHSVAAGLACLTDCDYIFIHDGARPMITEEILERAYECAKENDACVVGMPVKDTIKIAVIGKPNVGKSSLINCLLGENRVIVSSIAGTTRDSIDTPFEKDGDKYILIDTAGIRRKSKVNEDIERYSVVRAVAAIERCDVCLLVIDAAEGITDQDKKIAGVAHEAGKGIVVVVNKWDLIEKETNTMRDFKRLIEAEMQFMSYAPSVFISVKDKQRVFQVIEMAKYVAEKRAMRVPTGQLNSLIVDATMMKQPPSDKGRRLKIYYVTQVAVKPPLFSFQINKRELMHFSYARYLENKIREGFGFEGTSIKFVFREKGEKEE